MIGGQAFRNGVAFYTDEYWVKAIRDRENAIQVEVKRRNVSRHPLMKRFERIPFVRGLALIVSALLMNWKAQLVGNLFVFVLAGITSMLIHAQGGTQIQSFLSDNLGNHLERCFYLLFGTISVGVILLVRFTNMSRYHGAEHQVVEAYNQYNELSMDKIRSTSRVSRNCGSNFFVFSLLCFCLVACFPFFLWLKCSLSFVFGYELFLLDHRGRFGWLLAPLYWISGWLQEWFLTRKPTELELEVATRAFCSLLERDSQAFL